MKNLLVIFLMSIGLIACDGSKLDSYTKVVPQAKSLNCGDVKYGTDKYIENMDDLTKQAGMTAWNRNTEDFVSSLCQGDSKSSNNVLLNGGIQPDQAKSIASILGVQYTAPELKSDLARSVEPKSIKPIGPHCGDISAITEDVASQIGTQYKTDAREIQFDYANKANPDAWTCTVRVQTKLGPKFCSATEILLIGNQYVAAGLCRQ